MKPRATAELAQLSDVDFIDVVADGLGQLAGWIDDLERWATRLESDEAAGADVLRVIADEEAGKYLILVDAVRCPRNDGRKWPRQLKRCHDHLAKGIYAEVCNYRPASYEELLGCIEPLRVSHYLDGPNDVDWIFRNQIQARREQRLYVDYVRTDDGAGWWSPARYDHLTLMMSSCSSAAVEIVRALTRAGATSPEGLRTIADVWRPFQVEATTTHGQLAAAIMTTLERLLGYGLASQLNDREQERLLEEWPFPLYDADLAMIDVDRDELRERQRDWSFD